MTAQKGTVTALWPRFTSAIGPLEFTWKTAREYLVVLLGALIQALAMRLFLVPGQLVSGGISGAAQIINHFAPIPIGLMVFIGNVPLFFLGWRFLGGPRFALRTAIAVGAFSLFTDLLVFIIPAQGVTRDNVLNAVFGAVLLGVGLGLVYRGGGTSGGSDILGRILNHRLGISIDLDGVSHYRFHRCTRGRVRVLLGKSALWHGGHLYQRAGSGNDLRGVRDIPHCHHHLTIP